MDTSHLQSQSRESINTAYELGGFLLVLNVPKGTTVGLNWTEFTTDTNFMGFKMVPTNGTANFFFANASSQGAPEARTGHFFKLTTPGQICALKWDDENEMLQVYNGPLPSSESLKADDAKLAPFPYDRQGLKWKSLTQNIILSESHEKTIEYAPYYSSDEIPKFWFDREKATALEKYQYSEDSSWLLQQGNSLQLDRLVSDFEYNFVWFVLGQEEEAFEAWKKNMKLLVFFADGYKTNSQHAKHMKRFIRTLIIQLVEFPRDMFQVEQDQNLLFNYLNHLIIASQTAYPERSKRLASFVTDQFGWKLHDSGYIPEDEQPVVVEL